MDSTVMYSNEGTKHQPSNIFTLLPDEVPGKFSAGDKVWVIRSFYDGENMSWADAEGLVVSATEDQLHITWDSIGARIVLFENHPFGGNKFYIALSYRPFRHDVTFEEGFKEIEI